MPVKRTIERDLRDDVVLSDRFWSKVEIGDDRQCWPWRGAMSTPPRGPSYGKFGLKGVTHYAHRIAWALTYGPIPGTLRVLHRCDAPPCCNPAHLFLGTQADNMRDRKAKDRGNHPRGARNGRARLTEQDVQDIRRRWRSGEQQKRLADAFGVSLTCVHLLVHYRSWNHVP